MVAITFSAIDDLCMKPIFKLVRAWSWLTGKDACYLAKLSLVIYLVSDGVCRIVSGLTFNIAVGFVWIPFIAISGFKEIKKWQNAELTDTAVRIPLPGPLIRVRIAFVALNIVFLPLNIFEYLNTPNVSDLSYCISVFSGCIFLYATTCVGNPPKSVVKRASEYISNIHFMPSLTPAMVN